MRVLTAVLLVMLGACAGMTQDEVDQLARGIEQGGYNFNQNYQQSRPKNCWGYRSGQYVQVECY